MANAGKTYYLCVENGAPDGSRRSGQIMATVDNAIALTPADFTPENDPPSQVATQLLLDRGHGRGHDGGPNAEHSWLAALFGQPGSTIAVSIRVAK